MMLLEDIAKKDEKKTPDGTYVAVKFTTETVKDIKKMMKELKIPEPLESDKLHSTIIYSRKYIPNFKAKGKFEEPIIATPKHLTIFPTKGGKNALVMELDCPELVKRHEYIMDKHKAEYDWPEFKLHVTLSYDSGDFDPKGIDPKKYIEELEVGEEYSEDLQLEWLTKEN